MRFHEICETVIRLSGFKATSGSPADQLIRAVTTQSEDNPMNARQRILDGAVVELVGMGDDVVQIKDIRRVEPGGGQRALKTLCWLADRHGVVLTLYAYGYDEVPTERLVALYEKFGFVAESVKGDNGGIDMTRQPRDEEE